MITVNTSAEIAQCTDILTSSFYDYPLLKTFFPIAEKREQTLSFLYNVLTRCTLINGIARMDDNGNAAALWLHPGKTVIKSMQIIRLGGWRWFFRWTPSSIFRLMRTNSFLENIQNRWISDKTWYLFSIAVVKSARGKKLASILLNDQLEGIKKLGQNCYLETQTADNVEIYRRFGFELVEQSVIPGTDLVNYAMLFR